MKAAIGQAGIPAVTASDAALFFAASLDKDPAVEAVFWREVDEAVDIWAVIEGFDRDVEDRVFDAEAATLESYPRFRVDFGLIYRRGRELEDLQPAGSARAK